MGHADMLLLLIQMPLVSFACLRVFVYDNKHENILGSKHATMKTIAIISQKGGAGKTTIAIHLAVAAEQRGVRTAVFDLDPQASATSWSDRRKNPVPAVVAAQPPRLVNLLRRGKARRYGARRAACPRHRLRNGAGRDAERGT